MKAMALLKPRLVIRGLLCRPDEICFTSPEDKKEKIQIKKLQRLSDTSSRQYAYQVLQLPFGVAMYHRVAMTRWLWTFHAMPLPQTSRRPTGSKPWCGTRTKM